MDVHSFTSGNCDVVGSVSRREKFKIKYASFCFFLMDDSKSPRNLWFNWNIKVIDINVRISTELLILTLKQINPANPYICVRITELICKMVKQLKPETKLKVICKGGNWTTYKLPHIKHLILDTTEHNPPASADLRQLIARNSPRPWPSPFC